MTDPTLQMYLFAFILVVTWLIIFLQIHRINLKIKSTNNLSLHREK